MKYKKGETERKKSKGGNSLCDFFFFSVARREGWKDRGKEGEKRRGGGVVAAS